MSREQLSNDIWRACDIMRRDNNCGGVMEYVEHLAWLLFLKFLDEQEEVFATKLTNIPRKYDRLLEVDYRWSSWVPKALGHRNGNGRRTAPDFDGNELIDFVRNKLIPHLASLSGSPQREIIASVFNHRNVIVCSSPQNLKDVLAIVDGISFKQDDFYTIGEVYESLLRRLGQENQLLFGN